MDDCKKILTSRGVVKMPIAASHTSGKIRLYCFLNQEPEVIAKIQTLFELEMKGKVYQGSLLNLFTTIQITPYLLREGIYFSLISTEEVCEWGKKLLGCSQQVIKFYKEVLEISIKLNNQVNKATSYSYLGDACYEMTHYREAITYHKSHLKIVLALGDRIGAGRVYGNLGCDYQKLKSYRKAIKYHENCLKIALELGYRTAEGRSYDNLGMAYQGVGDYRRAIECHENCLKIALELGYRTAEGRSYDNLGMAYQGVGDYRRAIECHENCLKIALERSDLGEKRISYNNLGGAYTELGDCKRAIVFHEKALKITLELGSLEGEGMVYGNLGITYYKKGEYEKAITYQQKALKIAQETGDSEAEGRAYGNLGIFYQGIGEYKRALIYQEKELNIFLELGNLDSEAKCYGNLGATYYKFGDFRKAITYHEKTLKAALERGNLGAEGNAYNNLGIAYKGLGEYQKAITYHENHLKIALGLGDRGKEGGVYNNLGTVYQDLGEHSRAITYYNKFLNIALESGDLAGQKSVYYHLGIAYDSVKDLNQAEHYFRKGISVTATLLHQAKESKWQIPFFEQGSLSYRGLEEVLLKQEKYQEALQASDRRRGRALSFLISQKLLPKERENNALEGVTLQRITDLAKKFHTTFIIYSRVFMKYKEVPLQAWVISSRNKCIQSVVLPPLDHDFLKPHPLFKQFPYVIRAKRPQRTYPQTPYQGGLKEEKRPSQLFDETLVFWYKNLIAPLEPYLPAKHSGETLTFIPDHFLAHLPFGAFYNEKEDQYLIENYPIAVAPSIEVLSLLDQLPQESCKEVLLMGNPVTAQKEDHPLPYTESEVRDTIAPMVANLTVHLFTQNQATPAAVLAHAPFARLIHIACHGVGDQKPLEKPDPHSVFEGLFKLAPDHDHPMGHLHAEEIALMHLKADLVFMSACHLGRGNLKQEGSIGPVWSFLGAGAKSTISSYWPLPEGETTVKMVETFYRHYLGIGTPKLGKAHALQQAVLMVMQTERKRPRQWGALFLSGLIDEKG